LAIDSAKRKLEATSYPWVTLGIIRLEMVKTCEHASTSNNFIRGCCRAVNSNCYRQYGEYLYLLVLLPIKPIAARPDNINNKESGKGTGAVN